MGLHKDTRHRTARSVNTDFLALFGEATATLTGHARGRTIPHSKAQHLLFRLRGTDSTFLGLPADFYHTTSKLGRKKPPKIASSGSENAILEEYLPSGEQNDLAHLY